MCREFDSLIDRQNKQKNKVMMKEVLSGTFKSGKVDYVRINNNTDLLRSLKKIKKRFGGLKKITKFVKETR